MTLPPFSGLLLVCGSRDLAGVPGARETVIGILRDRLAGTPRDARIVTGDAPGPDAWAWLTFGVLRSEDPGDPAVRPVSRFTLFGSEHHETREPPGILAARWDLGWDLAGMRRDRVPLVRNAEMVRWAASRGVPCRAVGFVSPDPRTGGTDHTLTLCRDAGFASVERVVIE